MKLNLKNSERQIIELKNTILGLQRKNKELSNDLDLSCDRLDDMEDELDIERQKRKKIEYRIKQLEEQTKVVAQTDRCISSNNLDSTRKIPVRTPPPSASNAPPRAIAPPVPLRLSSSGNSFRSIARPPPPSSSSSIANMEELGSTQMTLVNALGSAHYSQKQPSTSEEGLFITNKSDKIINTSEEAKEKKDPKKIEISQLVGLLETLVQLKQQQVSPLLSTNIHQSQMKLNEITNSSSLQSVNNEFSPASSVSEGSDDVEHHDIDNILGLSSKSADTHFSKSNGKKTSLIAKSGKNQVNYDLNYSDNSKRNSLKESFEKNLLAQWDMEDAQYTGHHNHPQILKNKNEVIESGIEEEQEGLGHNFIRTLNRDGRRRDAGSSMNKAFDVQGDDAFDENRRSQENQTSLVKHQQQIQQQLLEIQRHQGYFKDEPESQQLVRRDALRKTFRSNLVNVEDNEVNSQNEKAQQDELSMKGKLINEKKLVSEFQRREQNKMLQTEKKLQSNEQEVNHREQIQKNRFSRYYNDFEDEDQQEEEQHSRFNEEYEENIFKPQRINSQFQPRQEHNRLMQTISASDQSASSSVSSSSSASLRRMHLVSHNDFINFNNLSSNRKTNQGPERNMKRKPIPLSGHIEEHQDEEESDLGDIHLNTTKFDGTLYGGTLHYEDDSILHTQKKKFNSNPEAQSISSINSSSHTAGKNVRFEDQNENKQQEQEQEFGYHATRSLQGKGSFPPFKSLSSYELEFEDDYVKKADRSLPPPLSHVLDSHDDSHLDIYASAPPPPPGLKKYMPDSEKKIESLLSGNYDVKFPWE